MLWKAIWKMIYCRINPLKFHGHSGMSYVMEFEDVAQVCSLGADRARHPFPRHPLLSLASMALLLLSPPASLL